MSMSRLRAPEEVSGHRHKATFIHSGLKSHLALKKVCLYYLPTGIADPELLSN